MLFKADIRRVEGLSTCRIEAVFHNTEASVAVVHMPDTPRNQTGKAMTRRKLTLLLPLLSKWPLKLVEKETGPWIVGPDLRQCAFVSITYAGGSAWVALSTECPVGIDAVSLEDCEGWEPVAETYFDQMMVKEISRAARPLNSFALHWASFEARLKCLGRGLSEEPMPLPSLEVYSALTNETALAIALDKQNRGESAKTQRV